MRLTTLLDDYSEVPKKLGRNELCSCGSGKKYKRCHLDREKQKPLRAWEGDGYPRMG